MVHFFFPFFYSHTVPLSQSLSFEAIPQNSLKLTLSPPSARLILNVTATEAWLHRPTNRPKPPISLKPTPLSVLDPAKKKGYWVPNWETHGARRPTPTLSSSPKPSSVIGDFLFCLWLVIFYFVWSGLVVFFSFCGLVVVVVVVMGVANGRDGCSWCCGFFLDNRIYYFIVVDILFYCIES